MSWLFRPVDRDQIFDELLPQIYSINQVDDPSKSAESPKRNPADTALLLMVYGLGALGDRDLPPCSEEAERYYQYARATLCLEDAIENPSLAAVQAAALMGAYEGFSGIKKLDIAWSTIRLASTLGVCVSVSVLTFS